MKIQWSGFAHETQALKYSFDNFGLANQSDLKFRTDSETHRGEGTVKHAPVIAVMSEGNPCANRPASASRLVVRNLIRNFRDECRTKQFTMMNYDRWLSFQCSQIQKKMLLHGMEEPEYEGFSASCTCMIINDGLAYIAQLGNTRLYQLRDKRVKDLSNEDAVEPLPEGYLFQNPKPMPSVKKDFRHGMLGVPQESYVEPHIYVVDVEKKDVFCFCTNSLDITIGANGFQNFFQRVWNSFNFRKAAKHMVAEGVKRCNDACVGSLFLRFC